MFRNTINLLSKNKLAATAAVTAFGGYGLMKKNDKPFSAAAFKPVEKPAQASMFKTMPTTENIFNDFQPMLHVDWKDAYQFTVLHCHMGLDAGNHWAHTTMMQQSFLAHKLGEALRVICVSNASITLRLCDHIYPAVLWPGNVQN